jgi:hypothetical protein
MIKGRSINGRDCSSKEEGGGEGGARWRLRRGVFKEKQAGALTSS